MKQHPINTKSVSADSLVLVAAELYKQNQPDSALIIYNQAIKYFQLSKQWDKWEQSVLEIRGIYRKENEHHKAAQFLKAQTDTAEKYLPPKHKTIGKLKAFLGISFSKTGDYTQALFAYENALKNFEDNERKDALCAQIYKNAGNIYTRRLDYYKAIDYLQKALQLNIQLDENAAAANVHSDLAIVYRYLEDYDRELFHYRQAISLPGIDTLQIAIFTTNQADTYLHQKQYDYTLQNCREALRLFKTQAKTQPDYIASVYNIMGEVFAAQNQFAPALENYRQALNYAGQAYGSHHRELARIQVSIGNLYFSQPTETKLAVEHYQDALIALIPEFSPDNALENPTISTYYPEPFIFTALTQKARSFYRLYQNDNQLQHLNLALATYELAVQQSSLMRLAYSAQEAKLYLGNYAYETLTETVKTAAVLYQITQKPEDFDKTLTLMEYGKAATLLESLRETETLQFANLPDSILEQKRTLELDIYRLANTYQPDAAQQDSLFMFKRNLEKFNSQVQQQYKNYRNLNSAIQASDIQLLRQQILTDTTALIAYFMMPDELIAVGLTQSKTAFYRFHTDTLLSLLLDQLISQIAMPSQSTNANENYRQFARTGNQLYRLLLEPLLKQLPDNISRLTFIPDGQLNYLPFETLLTELPDTLKTDYRPTHTPYLINRFAIGYAPSAALLAETTLRNAKANQTGNWIGFAPDFNEHSKENRLEIRNDCDSEDLLPLQCNQKEITDIQRFTGGKTVQAKKATKNQFLSDANDFEVIHLATHACIDNDQPMQSKIYFTDRPLMAYELYTLPVNAQLTVLSACNTGIGKWERGEGVMSLSRGFLYAGCSSLITTLWSVNDCATADIMTKFYQYSTKNHLGLPEALRQAKLSYLQNPSLNMLSAHPFFWAASIQTGSPRGFDNQIGKIQLLPFIGAIVLTIGGLAFFVLIWWKFGKNKNNRKPRVQKF
ncbi:MAG: CHAT domain-containing protein [Sphingobacteriales bacterium]|nr:MAG: CHAT domain-containing protein [Sphingobacteriales bacterium]